MKRIGTATVIVLLVALGALAQSAEQEVRKVSDAVDAAARAGDKATLINLIADDLRWLNLNGVTQSKGQFLIRITGAATPPKFSEIDVKVYGDAAVLMARLDFADGRKGHAHRVFVKRNGQWQLVSHTTAMPSAQQDSSLWFGTWRLNVAKSKYGPGPPPTSLTRMFEDRGDGVMFVTTNTVDAKGDKIFAQVALKYDAKDYPIARLGGAKTFDTVAARCIDRHTIQLTFKSDGKITSNVTETVSQDGRTMTFRPAGVDSVVVLEKQIPSCSRHASACG